MIKILKLCKLCSVDEILRELCSFIIAHTHQCLSDILKNPVSLIGKQINNRFQLEDSQEEKWFEAVVLGFCCHLKNVMRFYNNDEEEHCFFDLTQDLVKRDLIVKYE